MAGHGVWHDTTVVGAMPVCLLCASDAVYGGKLICDLMLLLCVCVLAYIAKLQIGCVFVYSKSSLLLRLHVAVLAFMPDEGRRQGERQHVAAVEFLLVIEDKACP